MKLSNAGANELPRRDVLKLLTTAAGASLCPLPLRLAIAQTNAAVVAPLARPIRALIRRGGRLLQPIQIQLTNASAGANVLTKLNGAETDRRSLSAGEDSFAVFIDPVSSPQDVHVAVLVSGRSEAITVKVMPVRQTLIYILPHSHHDLGYTDLQPKIEEKQIQNIALGIELAARTADYPEGSRFVWNLEVLWSADMYMERKSQAEKDALIEAVRRGRLSLNGMYANELTGLCRPEELLRLFHYSKVLSKKCGVAVDSAMLSDVPGYTWGTVTAMAEAGIRYFSAAPNNADRIGGSDQPGMTSLFGIFRLPEDTKCWSGCRDTGIRVGRQEIPIWQPVVRIFSTASIIPTGSLTFTGQVTVTMRLPILKSASS